MAKVTHQDLVTVHDAALTLGVSPDTIRRWHKKGLIKAQIGKHGERLFSSQELLRMKSKSSHKSHEWKILSAPKSKLTSIELFSGAGGLALGMHNAGIESKLLVDFDKNSISTLRKNKPKWNSLLASVTDIQLKEYRDQIDIMAGGFPCQAFSYAGKGLGFEDTRGTLFYDYARLIKQVNPKLVIGENVKRTFKS